MWYSLTVRWFHMWCHCCARRRAPPARRRRRPASRKKKKIQLQVHKSSSAGTACCARRRAPPARRRHRPAQTRAASAVPRRRKKKNSTSSSQDTQCCRNSLNVILDISTDCVSQWDSCRLSTASGEGKCLLLGYMLQGLDCQFSESEWWLPPLWGQPLARSCARKRMRTRIKKMNRRGDAIAGNLKLFAWAGLWIKTFGIKKRTSGNFGDVSG